MCKLCSVLGRSKLTARKGIPLADWIDCELDENRQPILDRIQKNISYHLGNSVQSFKLSEAADKLFNRDYKGKKQIFVPEIFLTKSPAFIFKEKEELEKILSHPQNDLSQKEKGKWRCRLATMEGEFLEKNVFDTLKEYFSLHSDQQVLILHGYEVMDLETLQDKKGKKQIHHWEKDFIVINVTYGYVLAIEAKKTLDHKSMISAREQLENTKKQLEKWFGADLQKEWSFFSAVYCEKGDKYKNCCNGCDQDFLYAGPEDLLTKLERLHANLQKQTEDEMDYASFYLMAKYLLFCSTYHPAPVTSVIDLNIKDMVEKAGDARIIIFWNWTPGQKNLLDADIPRVILTSYWSTGKTRIMFEKAKILAAQGKIVIFILDSNNSLHYSPILFHSHLMNEIEASKLNITLLLSDGQYQRDIANATDSQSDVHVFIDEFSFIGEDSSEKINSLVSMLGQKNYLWIAVGRKISGTDLIFDKWLKEKEEEGFFLPTLTCPLRNSKDIVDFDASYGKDSDKRLVGSYNMPTAGWPFVKLKSPSNQICAPKPVLINHDPSKSFNESILKCCHFFPSSTRILIIVMLMPGQKVFDDIPKDIVKAVHEARGHYPLVINHREYVLNEKQQAMKNWLHNNDGENVQDMIASFSSLGGFEWPSVLLITDNTRFNRFEEKNSIMRAMSRLVVLRSEATLSIHDLPKSLNTTTRDDTRLDEDRAYCKKDSCLMLLLGPGKKFLFLMARMIAIFLISIFLEVPYRLLSHHNQTISTIIFTGLVMGVVNQISTYFLDMKRLKWMILCLMLSVFECMLLTVLSSFLEEKLGIRILIMVIVFFNLPTITGLSADIYNCYQRNQANKWMGLILSTIGGIDLLIWLMLMLMLINYYGDFAIDSLDYDYGYTEKVPKNYNYNFSKNYTLIKIILINIVKFVAFANNQIIAQNVSNKIALIFWIAITALDCIASLATYIPNFISYDAWQTFWRLRFSTEYEICIAFCLIPKLLTAISAVYIVIKGLFGRSNQEQTTIEMDIMDPQLLNNMI